MLKATSYINDTIINNNLHQSNVMVPYVDIIGLCHSVAILCKSMCCGVNVI